MAIVIPFAVTTLATLSLVWASLVSHQRSANARVIAMHIIGASVPMLERHGFVMVRKRVSFGRVPFVKINMASESGLWIDVWASSDCAYFRLSASGPTGDDLSYLPHAFDVSGPWDELTEANLTRWQRSFNDWKDSGCHALSIGGEPGDFIVYYQPLHCTYVRKGHDTPTSPSDPGNKLRQRFDDAGPDQRYTLKPLVPLD
jgi:hypothetical protein